jgi:hypothetical protein
MTFQTTSYAATTGNFPRLIERLSLVRALGIEPERATRVHQNYWLKLAREGGQSTVQHLAELEPPRRYATLTALVLVRTHGHTDRRGTQYVRASNRADVQEI